MKNRVKYCLFIFAIMLVVGLFSITYVLLKKDKKNDSLININEVSQTFMEDYYKGIEKLNENNNQDNVLIVTSVEEPKNCYGATDIVKGPNHQYFIQYENNNDLENAKKSFEKDNIEVQNNIMYELFDVDYNSWGVSSMNMDEITYKIDEQSENSPESINDITVAIIDTGIDLELFNEYYEGKIEKTYTTASNTSSQTDSVGHGTHIAGTIAESTPDNVKIFPIKVSDSTSLSSYNIIAAINYIVYNKAADVINMSFGSSYNNNAEYTAIEAANENNIICVAAAGNDDSSDYFYPASYDNTISVSAVDENLNIADFSNHNDKVTFAAPGVQIDSINGIKSGTSMASPHLASAVAIVKSINKSLTLDNTINLLKQHTIDLGTEGYDNYYGNGYVNFDDLDICDGESCDEYNVFKIENSEKTALKIEQDSEYEVVYNYGTISNILNAKIRIYYATDEYYTKSLYEIIDDITISNYKPNVLEKQTVTIQYKDLACNISIDNSLATKAGWNYETIDANNIKLTKMNDISDDFNYYASPVMYIPNEIDDKNVVELGESIYYEDTYVKKIILPDSVTKIDNEAFEYSSIELLKANNIEVGDYTFDGCEKLKKVDATITSLGDFSFSYDKALYSINLSDNITTIPYMAFAYCSILPNINLPENLKTIKSYAFASSGIENITLPDNLEEIENYAFLDCELKELIIPKNVSSIDQGAFAYNDLEKVSVNTNNTTYNSNDDINAVIETKTNTLILGSANTKIPDGTLEIGNSAFEGNGVVRVIKLPETINKIGDYAFYETGNYMYLYLPHKDIQFGTQVFDYQGTAYSVVVKDSNNYKYLKDSKYQYVTYETTSTGYDLNKSVYNAFDTVAITDIKYIDDCHEIGYWNGSNYKIMSNISYGKAYTTDSNFKSTIKYIDGRSYLSASDTYYNLEYSNSFGDTTTAKINITVNKINPTYNIPSNLTAKVGETLDKVILPEGFSWQYDKSEMPTIAKVGVQTYKATYTPSDTINYNIIKDIDISINVQKTILYPSITSNIIYSGNSEIESKSSIKINNMGNADYEIISAKTSSTDVGATSLTIILKLSDEAYKNYSFEGDLQEKTFIQQATILPKPLKKPQPVNESYKYNGNEQEFELTDFDETTMNILNNKRTLIGTQNVIVSLKNSNYIWDDNTTDDLEYEFTINKGEIDTKYTISYDTFYYDNLEHSSEVKNISNNKVKILYMDEKGEYTLESSPKYKDIGTYQIKFKLYIDENYNELYGSITLKIDQAYLEYNSNNSYIETIKENYLNGETVKVKSNKFTYTNYEFVEWNTKADGTGISYKSGDNIEIDGIVKLYAIWNPLFVYKIKNYTLNTGNNFIGNIPINTTLNEYKNNFELNNNVTISVETKQYQNQQVIFTGSKTAIYQNSIKYVEFTNVIKGDVNGDGAINSADLLRIRQHLLSINILNKEYYDAADINKDDTINSADLLRVRQYLLGIKTIQ